MRYIQFLFLMLLLVGSFVVMSYGLSMPGLELIVFGAGVLMFCGAILGAVEIGRRGLRPR